MKPGMVAHVVNFCSKERSQRQMDQGQPDPPSKFHVNRGSVDTQSQK